MSLNEAGVVTITMGISIFGLGAILLFDKALIIAGNILIVIGFILLLRSKTFTLLKFERIQGTIMFVMGFFAIFMGYSMLGFLLELGGMFSMFKNSLPDFRTVLFKLIFSRKAKKE